MKEPLHYHCAVVGVENGCSICNPICYENHDTSETMNLKCDNPNCPVVTIRSGYSEKVKQ